MDFKIKIPEKITTMFANLDEKNRYFLFIGILLFVFLLDYFILMGPQLGALSKLNPDIKILLEDINKTKTDIQRLSSYQKEVVRAKATVEEANLKVRSREESPVILETISRFANKNGIKIDEIMPDPTGQKLLLDNKERKYYALPIQVEAKSGYHNFGRFLYQIETEGLFLKMGGVVIASNPDSKYHTVKLTLKAVIFEDVKPSEKK